MDSVQRFWIKSPGGKLCFVTDKAFQLIYKEHGFALATAEEIASGGEPSPVPSGNRIAALEDELINLKKRLDLMPENTKKLIEKVGQSWKDSLETK